MKKQLKDSLICNCLRCKIRNEEADDAQIIEELQKQAEQNAERIQRQVYREDQE